MVLHNFHVDAVLGLTPFTVKWGFHIFKWNFPYFNLCPLPLWSFHWAPLRSIWLRLFLFYEILLSLFFSRLCNHSSFTLSSCQLPQSFNDLWKDLDLLTGFTRVCPCPEEPRAGQHCRSVSHAEMRGILTSLALLAQLCPMQTRMLLAFFVTSMHCRLLSSLLPIRIWFSLCLEIVFRVIWYTCRTKEKVWNNLGGDNMTLETSV